MENNEKEREEHLNPEKTALVVIDLQNGIVNSKRHFPYSGEQVVANAGRLAKAFAEKGAFVVLVRVSMHDGKDALRPKTDIGRSPIRRADGWDEYVPELAGCKGAYTLTKRQWGAFFGTDLDLQLRRRGIDSIVLCGISTAFGVDTTAREAYQRGYHQIFAEDAMTAGEKEEHEYVCNYIFPKIGRIRSTDEVIGLLAPQLP